MLVHFSFIGGSVDVKAFLSGFLIGAMFLYIAFQSHVIRSDDGYFLVPKQPAIPLSDTYVDVRGWKSEQWQQHPRIVAALKEAEKEDVIGSGESDGDDSERPPAELPLRRTQAKGEPETRSIDHRSTASEQSPVAPITSTVSDRVADSLDQIKRPIEDAGDQLNSLQQRFMDDIDEAYWGARRDTADRTGRVEREFSDAVDDFYKQNPSARDPFRGESSRIFREND